MVSVGAGEARLTLECGDTRLVTTSEPPSAPLQR